MPRLQLILVLFVSYAAVANCNDQDPRVLQVGVEAFGETMALGGSERVYAIDGLRRSAWYEVKISYPASVPASFSLRLVRNPSDVGNPLLKNRRLLNTEKLIFQADAETAYVVVTVEAEGVVAIPGLKEHEYVIFNIVCDELLLGIPRFTWWVGIAAIFCVLLASVLPRFLQLQCLVDSRISESKPAESSKHM